MRKIEGYENYFVDREGNVFRMLKPTWKKDTQRTYKQVALSEEGVYKTHLIHRLVAKAYIPNPNNYSVVHHKDGDKFNNHIDNLEWIDEKDHRVHHVKMGECRVNNFVECLLYKNDEFIGEFKSIAEASRYAVEHFNAYYYPLTRNKKYKDITIVKKSATTIRKE